MALSDEDQAEATRLGDTLTMTDEMVLSTMQDAVMDAYMTASSEAHGGAMVSLSSEARAIWKEAVKQSFDRWLANR